MADQFANLLRLQAIPISASMQLHGACIIVKPMTVAQQLRQKNAFRDGTNDQVPDESAAMRCKRRIEFVHSACSQSKLLGGTVAKRNERERNRVRQVNLGFAALREHVPNGRNNKKMSKVETLRGAMTYIKQLQDILKDSTSNSNNLCYTSHENDENELLPLPFSENISPVPSEALSPSQSLCSDSEQLSPEEEELLDFVAWF